MNNVWTYKASGARFRCKKLISLINQKTRSTQNEDVGSKSVPQEVESPYLIDDHYNIVRKKVLEDASNLFHRTDALCL